MVNILTQVLGKPVLPKKRVLQRTGDISDFFQSTLRLAIIPQLLIRVSVTLMILKFTLRNFSNAFSTNKNTLEIRALRPQRNAQDLVDLVTLFQSRLDYLKQFKEVLAYDPSEIPAKRIHIDQDTGLIENVGIAFRDFYDYVAGAGLNPDAYSRLLPDRMLTPEFRTLRNRYKKLALEQVSRQTSVNNKVGISTTNPIASVNP